MRRASRRNRERGSFVIFLALLLFVFCGFAALAIDANYIGLVRTEARHAVEAGAHAAAVRWTLDHDNETSIALSSAVLNANSVAGGPVDPSGAEIQLVGCDWDYPESDCDVGRDYDNGYRVRLSSLAGAGGGLPLFLAPILGFNTFDVDNQAIFAIRSTNVYVVVDISSATRSVSASMNSAVMAFLQELWHSPQDRVGIITVVGVAANALNQVSRPWIPVRLLPDSSSLGTFRTQTSNLDWCSCPFCTPAHITSAVPRCDLSAAGTFTSTNRGANHGAGINLAVTQLRSATYADRKTEQTVVVLTNQAPNNPSVPTDDAVWRALAVSAVNAANSNNISVHVVYLNSSGNVTQRDFMAGLPRGIGEFHEVAVAADLTAAMEGVARSVPVAMVE